jgi:hypothetical protein
MYTLVETSVVYVCNFIATDFVDNTDTLQVAALGVLNHWTQHYVNSGTASISKLKISKDMRMPYRRLVPKTADIKSNKPLVHNVCFGYFIDSVTSMPEGDQTTGEWR